MYVGETTCDGKKIAWEILSEDVSVHVIDIPQMKRPKDIDAWADEIKMFLVEVEKLTVLSNRYMSINCACFTPNEGRIDDILRLAKEYNVDGIIDVNLKFCNLYDTEGYKVERAIKEAGIPVLGIETDYTDQDAEQLRTRVGAFIEMLNNK